MADIDVFGRKVRPLAATAIGAGSLAVIWFAWRQRKASAGTGTPASAIDPLTGLPASQDNATDPLTGEGYLAEAQQYGSVQAAEQALSGTGIAGTYQDNYGYGGGYGTGGAPLVTGTTVQGTSYATDAAWAQAVEAGLTDIGYSPTDVAAALGRYLGSLPETSAQASIIRTAIAEYGPPPVGSYQVIMSSGTGPPATGGTAPDKAPGLSVTPQAGHADFGWDAVTGAAGYELAVTGAGGKGTGTSHYDQVIGGTHAEGLPLAPGAYRAQVRAVNNSGLGPWSAARPFTVTK